MTTSRIPGVATPDLRGAVDALVDGDVITQEQAEGPRRAVMADAHLVGHLLTAGVAAGGLALHLPPGRGRRSPEVSSRPPCWWPR